MQWEVAQMQRRVVVVLTGEARAEEPVEVPAATREVDGSAGSDPDDRRMAVVDACVGCARLHWVRDAHEGLRIASSVAA